MQYFLFVEHIKIRCLPYSIPGHFAFLVYLIVAKVLESRMVVTVHSMKAEISKVEIYKVYTVEWALLEIIRECAKRSQDLDLLWLLASENGYTRPQDLINIDMICKQGYTYT